MNYQGELRAVGDVLADQIPQMRRCGITSFAVTHAPTRAALEAGRLAEVKHYYQPIPTAPAEAPAGTRPWLRQPAG
jgi:phosphoadenosine phosphosulfate reductase